MSNRIKYSYNYIISYFGLDDEFNWYCRKHKKVNSFRRLARSFLVKKGVDYQHEYFSVDAVSSRLHHLDSVVHAKWLDE